MNATLTEIIYEPEHWNQNCGCMIPAGYAGYVAIDDPLSPIDHTKIMGHTPEDVIEAARREGIQVSVK